MIHTDKSRDDLMQNVNMQTCLDIFGKVCDYSTVKTVIAVLALILSYVFGDIKGATPLLIIYILVIFDTITGLVKAGKAGEISSSKFFRAAVKFFVYTILIVACRLFDKVLPTPFAAVIMESYLSVTEMISLLENAHAIGVPMPPKLMKYLRVLKDESK